MDFTWGQAIIIVIFGAVMFWVGYKSGSVVEDIEKEEFDQINEENQWWKSIEGRDK